jgi:hypothetical protein
MAMHALVTVPLINCLRQLARQIWFADDSAGSDVFTKLKRWWDLLNEIGPSFSYYPNASNTHLIVKPPHLSSAMELFRGSSVNIFDQGHGYLGSLIGTTSYIETFVSNKVREWEKELLLLSFFAESQPHSTFAYGLYSKWTFFSYYPKLTLAS